MRRALVLFVLLASVRAAAADPPSLPSEATDETLCAIIESAATTNDLPISFLTRLIWRESSLRPESVSPAGAEGVAQFMPRTAAERGLTDPFDPEKAIPAAARFLSDLAARFGNLGLAAAAYNGGPNLVSRFLAGRADMPYETRGYVVAITGRTVEDWAKEQPQDATPAPPLTLPNDNSASPAHCVAIVASLRVGVPAETISTGPFAPWGVQLAGNFSKAVALASFGRMRNRYESIVGDTEPFVLASHLHSRGSHVYYRVRLPAVTRLEAQKLCDKLHAAGAPCIVLRS
jgi:Transglycosylase SLT domain/SPOR domain